MSLLNRTLRLPLLLAGIVALSMLVPLWLGGPDILPRLRYLTPANVLWLGAVMGSIWLLNALRFRLLIGQPDPHFTFGVWLRSYLAMEFVSRTTPGGSGAPLAFASLLAPYGVSTSRALAIFTLSGLLDTVIIGTLAATLLTFVGSASGYLPAQVLAPVAIATPLLLITAFYLLFRHLASVQRLIASAHERLNTPRKRRLQLARAAVRYRQSMQQIVASSWQRNAAVAVLAMTYWGLYLSTLAFAVIAVGGQIDWLPAMLYQIVALSAGHLLMVPGGAGGSEAAAALLLTPAIGAASAASAILVWRALVLYAYLAAGALAMPGLTRRQHRHLRDLIARAYRLVLRG